MFIFREMLKGFKVTMGSLVLEVNDDAKCVAKFGFGTISGWIGWRLGFEVFKKLPDWLEGLAEVDSTGSVVGLRITVFFWINSEKETFGNTAEVLYLFEAFLSILSVIVLKGSADFTNTTEVLLGSFKLSNLSVVLILEGFP